MKQLKDAFIHRGGYSPPASVSGFMAKFDHSPRQSVTALLRKAGPFNIQRDAFRFRNNETEGWPITREDARVLRERYQRLVEPISVLGIATLRRALTGLQFSIMGASAGLPIEVIDLVITKVSGNLRDQLLDRLVVEFTGEYGRCGGMAFAAYDFFLTGWPVDDSPMQPSSGDLRQYIWNRLLDSLELNALAFFEWIMVLHVLPVISRLASAALASVAGSIVGGPLGAAIGAFIGGKEDILNLGGKKELLHRTREHWQRLQEKLNKEAAWPIGFVYGGTVNPIDQHQVLATNYVSRPDGTYLLTLWDNNDGNQAQYIVIDLRGGELVVSGSTNPTINTVKGIICEEYIYQMPPQSLHRS